MDLDNLLKIISIRNYIGIAANNMNVDKDKVRSINNLLYFLDSQLISAMALPSFKESLEVLLSSNDNAEKVTAVVEPVKSKKSGLVKISK